MSENYKRILIVDDVAAIHEDFRRILTGKSSESKLSAAKAALGKLTSEKDADDKSTDTESINYIIDSASQGQEAVELIKKGLANNEHYALAFVDIRMPPGWDGVTTIKNMWEIDPDIQVAICTAYSDYSWENITKQLVNTDNFLILKKPFDVVEIRQLAASLTKKWALKKQVQFQIDNLQELVKARTRELDSSLSLTTATLESTHEGLLVTDNEGKIILSNQLFSTLWEIPNDLFNLNTLDALLVKLSEQVVESNLFYQMMLDLAKNPKEGVAREWTLQNKKVFELYTHPHFLHNEIVGCVFSFLDITERKQLEKQLQHQATHDDLTGLPNRPLNLDRIQQAIAYAKRNNTLVAIIMLDLDNFKRVNDTLGHDVGDSLIKTVAARLSSSIRETDTVSRISGDEFSLIITSYTDQNDLLARINTMFSIFSVPMEVGSHHLHVTPSIGVSIYPKDGETPEVLLKNADIALYHAKEMGRNNIQFYHPTLGEKLYQQVDIISAIHHALANNEFIVHYQPLVDIKTNKILGFEALVRWNHPTLGLLLPDSFIPLAERSGLVNDIGKWVMKTACTQAEEWHRTLNIQLNMAVNISGYQFSKNEFVDDVIKVVKETKFDPKFLILEITESVILGNPTEVSNKMRQLKEIGINFAVDDFGTGYSTLNYLKFYPFDCIKIDKSFIQGVNNNQSDRSIVEAIINMSRTLGIDVLAEGVEKEEQIHFLKDQKAYHVQGNYFSPSIDAEKCTQLLKDNAGKKEPSFER